MSRPLPCTNQELVKFIQLHHNEKTAFEIGKQFGVNPHTVYEIARRNGMDIKITANGRPTRDLVNKWIDFIKNNPHLTIPEMAKDLGIIANTVRGLCIRGNLPHKAKRYLEKPILEGEFFNVDEHETWII